MFLFEAGVRFGTHTTSTIDLGVLVHQGPRSAWGMTIGYLATQARPETTGQAAIVSKSGMYQARYRRYLGGQGGALDLGIGTGRYGVSGEVSLGIRDIIAVTGGVNTFQFEGGRDVAANVGVRLGTEGIAYLLYALISLAPR